MKSTPTAGRSCEFQKGRATVELMIVLCAILVLSAVFHFTVMKEQQMRVYRIKCVNGLKNSSVALKIFADDNGDRYPYQQRPALTNRPLVETPVESEVFPTGPSSPLYSIQSLGYPWEHFVQTNAWRGNTMHLLIPR